MSASITDMRLPMSKISHISQVPIWTVCSWKIRLGGLSETLVAMAYLDLRIDLGTIYMCVVLFL